MSPFLTDTLIYVGYFVILLIGVVAHFFKKQITGETLADIKFYFSSHFKSTITTFIAASVLYASLIATGTMGILPVFFAGYTADSLFGKADEEAAAKLSGIDRRSGGDR